MSKLFEIDQECGTTEIIIKKDCKFKKLNDKLLEVMGEQNLNEISMLFVEPDLTIKKVI